MERQIRLGRDSHSFFSSEIWKGRGRKINDDYIWDAALGGVAPAYRIFSLCMLCVTHTCTRHRAVMDK